LRETGLGIGVSRKDAKSRQDAKSCS